MHITILLASLLATPATLLLFLVLKTIADLAMHIIEHNQKWNLSFNIGNS